LGNIREALEADIARYEAIASERAKLQAQHGTIPCCEAPINPSVAPICERWYVVYTDAAKEFRAKNDLISQGFRIYLPCLRKWDHHRNGGKVGTRHICLRPLFPRYLFTLIDLARRPSSLREIRDTDGAVGVLCNADRPAPVPDVLVTVLQRKEMEGEYDATKPKSKVAPFSPGDRVEVVTGPFANFFGRIKELRAHERVAVLLQFLGGASPVDLPLDTVMKV
jgi:transcriptional antiterminator RfaH